jgi:hypothetical protein
MNALVFAGSHAKNAVVMSNGTLDWGRPDSWTGMLDRSPCGTGKLPTFPSACALRSPC